VNTLLIVDDNTLNLDFMGALLTRLGYAVILAENGRDALRLAAERHPDAIFMDIELVDESGIDATNALRADPTTAKIPVIALTGLDPADTVGQFETVGFAAIIRKPASIGALKSVLGKVLGA
jgi:CheY-like chemotaxis protein